MIVLGEHQFCILKDFLGIDLVIRVEAIFASNFSHSFKCLLDLRLQFCPLTGFFGLLEDGFDNTHVVLVEIEGEERVGSSEVVAR
jgi:hypothetical protein